MKMNTMETTNISQKENKNRIHPRLKQRPKGNKSQGCILFCQKCDDSIRHLPVKRFMRQWENEYIPCDYKTSKRSTLLKCNRCGNEVKNLTTAKSQCIRDS